MLEILKSIIYGIVEGITEWLPVSSTGHLILVEKIIPFESTSDGFFEMFDVVIQLGAIMAVVVLFWSQIWPFYLKSNVGKHKHKHSVRKSRKDPAIGNVALSMDAFWMWVKIVVACIPAVIYGVLLDDEVNELFEQDFLGTSMQIRVLVVAIMLAVVGVLFIVVENHNKGKEAVVEHISDLSFKDAFIIGLFQLVAAALPGTSRSGSTILGGISIGISRKVAAEFTFFLGIPVMFGASLLKIVKFGFAFSGLELPILLVASVVSFVVSLFVIKFLMGYIKQHDFKVFGYYRIALGIVVIICGLTGFIG